MTLLKTDSRHILLIWTAVSAMLVWFLFLVVLPATQPSVIAFVITGLVLMFIMAIAMARWRWRRAALRRSMINAKQKTPTNMD